MEVTTHRFHLPSWLGVCLVCLLLWVSGPSWAQAPVKKYTVRDGKMYIELSKNLSLATLDSFITQFNLADLGLKTLFKQNDPDSLKKQGWKIETNTDKWVILSKSMMSFENLSSPADRIIFAEKPNSTSVLFPSVSQAVKAGVNRFKTKRASVGKEDEVVFFFRNNNRGRQVFLAGSFNNWSPTELPMTKTDSGWVARLPLAPGKYWYKFVQDGHWTTDPENTLKENDGRGNINSVYYKTNVEFKLPGYQDAKRVYVTGSFNNWEERELLLTKTPAGWVLPIYLANGTHTYRFIVDGKWMQDPNNPQKLPNEFGQYNSVIQLGDPYTFTLPGYTNARNVVLSGSFNNWREDELYMTRTASGWQLPYVLGPGMYEYKFRVDNTWVLDPANKYSALNGDNKANSLLILQPNYTFRLKGFLKAMNVHLAGDFNGWNPTGLAMERDAEGWFFSVHLSPGKHMYKFVVDGQWILDPANPHWEQNEHHTGNSVLWAEQ